MFKKTLNGHRHLHPPPYILQYISEIKQDLKSPDFYMKDRQAGRKCAPGRVGQLPGVGRVGRSIHDNLSAMYPGSLGVRRNRIIHARRRQMLRVQPSPGVTAHNLKYSTEATIDIVAEGPGANRIVSTTTLLLIPRDYGRHHNLSVHQNHLLPKRECRDPVRIRSRTPTEK
eukprot:scaffold853_cov200-Alexandrium_tamarense.AAC.1